MLRRAGRPDPRSARRRRDPGVVQFRDRLPGDGSVAGAIVQRQGDDSLSELAETDQHRRAEQRSDPLQSLERGRSPETHCQELRSARKERHADGPCHHRGGGRRRLSHSGRRLGAGDHRTRLLRPEPRPVERLPHGRDHAVRSSFDDDPRRRAGVGAADNRGELGDLLFRGRDRDRPARLRRSGRSSSCGRRLRRQGLRHGLRAVAGQRRSTGRAAGSGGRPEQSRPRVRDRHHPLGPHRDRDDLRNLSGSRLESSRGKQALRRRHQRQFQSRLRAEALGGGRTDQPATHDRKRLSRYAADGRSGRRRGRFRGCFRSRRRGCRHRRVHRRDDGRRRRRHRDRQPARRGGLSGGRRGPADRQSHSGPEPGPGGGGASFRQGAAAKAATDSAAAAQGAVQAATAARRNRRGPRAAAGEREHGEDGACRGRSGSRGRRCGSRGRRCGSRGRRCGSRGRRRGSRGRPAPTAQIGSDGSAPDGSAASDDDYVGVDNGPGARTRIRP